MELIDRYLHAVKFWLPKAQAADIIAELGEDIHTQVDEQEHELGRELTSEETADLLRKRGRPVLVANHYLPQQYLIGPLFFPIYKFVLKIVALCCLVPWVSGWLALIVASGGRDFHGWVVRFGSMGSSLWSTAFLSAAVVTMVFAVLERAEAKSHFMETWDPRKLPPVRNPRKISRSCAAVELAVTLVFAVWWAVNLSSAVLDLPFARITLSGTWTYFFGGFLAVMLGSAALAAASLIDPHWTVRRATAKLLIDCAGAALFCWLLGVHIVAGIAAPDLTPIQAHELADAINLWAARVMPSGLIIGVIAAAVNVHRIRRLRMGDQGRAGTVNGQANGPTPYASPLP
ncbi:MAG TPA: hypothetical protein VKB88_35905 [Bryobacteraceae bacterium]|nr:hypothetical protein [Bryobacteraceae bacterium]